MLLGSYFGVLRPRFVPASSTNVHASKSIGPQDSCASTNENPEYFIPLEWDMVQLLEELHLKINVTTDQGNCGRNSSSSQLSGLCLEKNVEESAQRLKDVLHQIIIVGGG